MSTKRFNFKFLAMGIIALSAGLMVLSSNARAAGGGGDHPFPWPRVLECPVSWNVLRGRYRVVAVETYAPTQYENHMIILDVRPSRRREGTEFVQISEYGRRRELYAEGSVYTPVTSPEVRGVLRQQASNTQYMVEIRAFRRRKYQRCSSDDLILSISYCSLTGESCQVGSTYELVRSE